MKRLLLLLLIISSCSPQKRTSSLELREVDIQSRSADQILPVQIQIDSTDLFGTLLLPKSNSPIPLALIIPGSGPTDRDGNNPIGGKSNSYKMLAEGLNSQGIAVLRYDKRMIGESTKQMTKEEDLRFDQGFIDAGAWVKQYENDVRFNNFIVLGHSEGSLLGMKVAQEHSSVSHFVSIAGPALPADQIILEQIKKQAPAWVEPLDKIFLEFKEGKLVSDVDPSFFMLARPSVQPYLISWFKYDPSLEIRKLDIPILLLQGTTDLQVPVKEAKALNSAQSSSKLVIIEGMNHGLKKATLDPTENFKISGNPEIPVMQECIQAIVDFIKN